MNGVDSGDYVKKARMLLYGLVRSFFDSLPNGEKIRFWQDVSDGLADSGIGFGELDASFSGLSRSLAIMKPTEIEEEFYELFENPFSDHKVQLCASFYIDGHLFGQSLVKLRQLLYKIGLGKVDGYSGSEDSLIFLSDVMLFLIDKEGESSVFDSYQRELFMEFLSPCERGIARTLKGLSDFPFYRMVGGLLEGHLLLEGSLFPAE